jgi:hypothetical protein
MTSARISEAQQLQKLIAQYGGKRGSIKKAAMKVYENIPEHLRYDRARQTLSDYRKFMAKKREIN